MKWNQNKLQVIRYVGRTPLCRELGGGGLFWVREIARNQDQMFGPFSTPSEAEDHARRLNTEFDAAVAAEPNELLRLLCSYLDKTPVDLRTVYAVTVHQQTSKSSTGWIETGLVKIVSQYMLASSDCICGPMSLERARLWALDRGVKLEESRIMPGEDVKISGKYIPYVPTWAAGDFSNLIRPGEVFRGGRYLPDRDFRPEKHPWRSTR